MSDIASILRAHLAQALEDDRKQHLHTPHGRPVYTLRHVDDHTSPIDMDLDVIGHLLSDAREALAARDVRRVAHLVAQYAEQHSVPEESRMELALGLLKVNVQALEAGHRRLLDGVVDDIALPEQRTPSPNPTASTQRSASPLLSRVASDYTDLMSKEGGWRGQTLSQSQTTYRMFIQCVGDLPMSSYERAHTDAFYQLLRKLPAMYAKAKVWQHMTPSEVAEATRGDDSLPRLTMKTMKRHFASLGGLFTYAHERGLHAGTNPAHGFRFPDKRRASARRQMWSGDKLKQLFASPVFTGYASVRRRHVPGDLITKDEKYWLPLLGLYHGNRLEEFAQLRRSDVRRENDIWFLDINDDGDKQIKNEQSRRKVPIHPEVQRLGFLEYVEATAPLGDALLFPQLKPGGADAKYGHSFTKWWTRYRQDIGLYEAGLDYHSFRHGVTTKLTEAGVAAAVIDQLTGHAGTGTSQTIYTKELTLPLLYEAISKVGWPELSL